MDRTKNNKIYYELHKAEIAEKRRQYYLENKPRMNEQSREYRINNPEKVKEYQLRYKDRKKQYQAKFYFNDENRLKVNKKNLAYYYKHKDELAIKRKKAKDLKKIEGK